VGVSDGGSVQQSNSGKVRRWDNGTMGCDYKFRQRGHVIMEWITEGMND
jgi:hypothetical protein